MVRFWALVLAAGVILGMPVHAELADQYQVNPQREKLGRIYHYVRSNTDDSVAERVSVFREDRTHVQVYKARGRCEPATVVKAELDLDLMSPVKITGGRLDPGAKIEEFAFLHIDRETKKLGLRVELPDQRIDSDVAIEAYPWHLYDFDLASLTVLTPYLKDPKAGFSFDLVLVLYDPELDPPIQHMGRAAAEFQTLEERNGQSSLRFKVAGPAFRDQGGDLWLDADSGHIVEARFKMPNHLGYRDFKLTLTSVDDGGADTWRAYLLAHHHGCSR